MIKIDKLTEGSIANNSDRLEVGHRVGRGCGGMTIVVSGLATRLRSTSFLPGLWQRVALRLRKLLVVLLGLLVCGGRLAVVCGTDVLLLLWLLGCFFLLHC